MIHRLADRQASTGLFSMRQRSLALAYPTAMFPTSTDSHSSSRALIHRLADRQASASPSSQVFANSAVTVLPLTTRHFLCLIFSNQLSAEQAVVAYFPTASQRSFPPLCSPRRRSVQVRFLVAKQRQVHSPLLASMRLQVALAARPADVPDPQVD